jgi:hypothetical protein
VSLRKLWEPTIDKPKPSSGWGVIAVILAAIAITVSMCEYATNKIETEDIKLEAK